MYSYKHTKYILSIFILLLCIVLSFLFVNDKGFIFTLTNYTFIFGLLMLTLCTIFYLLERWFTPVFLMSSGKDFRSKEKHANSLVDYKVDPDTIKEQEQQQMQKNILKKEIVNIQLTVAVTLLTVAVVLNLVYYMIQ
ncbi:hypothetical protein V1503_22600 [Bacillus sp. SCS-151]|uniref:hypothetical protein n=1 Tax=Nanhaiella sioensis TaxID=3115293 RepID=UPI00397C7A92